MRPALLATAAVLLVAAAGRADVVHLKNGRVIEGTVIAETARDLRLKTPEGIIVLPKVVVATIERCETPEVELGDRLAQTDLHDPAAVEALAVWASSRGL